MHAKGIFKHISNVFSLSFIALISKQEWISFIVDLISKTNFFFALWKKPYPFLVKLITQK